MQSQASPNGSLARPGWQPAILPGFPCSGTIGQQLSMVPVAVVMAPRQPAVAQAPFTGGGHWPVASTIAWTPDDGPPKGGNASANTAG